MTINDVPNPILEIIFDMLDSKGLVNADRICKKWHALINGNKKKCKWLPFFQKKTQYDFSELQYLSHKEFYSAVVKMINEYKDQKKCGLFLHKEKIEVSFEFLKFILQTPILSVLVIQDSNSYKMLFRFFKENYDRCLVNLISKDKRLSEVMCVLIKEILKDFNLRGSVNSLEYEIYQSIYNLYALKDENLFKIIYCDDELVKMIVDKRMLIAQPAWTGTIGSNITLKSPSLFQKRNREDDKRSQEIEKRLCLPY